jgi:nicotinamide-nucleotide amidase
MFNDRLDSVAERVASLLKDHAATVAVAEGSGGGLISASLLAVPGASAYYAGGVVIYTMGARQALLADAVPIPPGLRGATEEFALYLARSASTKLGATWGVGEGGAAGPTGNRYGDPAGHAWVAVVGPAEASSHVLTGSADRRDNMVSFATAALTLLADQLEATPPASRSVGR